MGVAPGCGCLKPTQPPKNPFLRLSDRPLLRLDAGAAGKKRLELERRVQPNDDPSGPPRLQAGKEAFIDGLFGRMLRLAQRAHSARNRPHGGAEKQGSACKDKGGENRFDCATHPTDPKGARQVVGSSRQSYLAATRLYHPSVLSGRHSSVTCPKQSSGWSSGNLLRAVQLATPCCLRKRP